MQNLMKFYRKLYFFRQIAKYNTDQYSVYHLPRMLQLIIALPKSKLTRVLDTTVVMHICGNKSNTTNQELIKNIERIYSRKLLINSIKSTQGKIHNSFNIAIKDTDSELWKMQQWYFVLRKCFPEFTNIDEYFASNFSMAYNTRDLYKDEWQSVPDGDLNKTLELAVTHIVPMSKQVVNNTH